MKLFLPWAIAERLEKELRHGNWQEIGGVLVGQHVVDETFRIVDISVQHSGGSAAHFVRDPEKHRQFLADFFAGTGHDYQRFNYIGEWHSHPSFSPFPSGVDNATMHEILYSEEVAVNFLILIIVRLRRSSNIQLSATLYRRGAQPCLAEVIIEGVPSAKTKVSLLQRALAFFRR